MSTSRYFMQAVRSLVDLKLDLEPLQTYPQPGSSTLSQLLADIGPLPREALFLGMAQDGLPVLLNLQDPVPGPLLVAGDAGTGRTAFLQTLVRALQRTHAHTAVQYAVVTSRPEEWQRVPVTAHRVGIFPADQQGAEEVLLSLAGWAHADRSKQAVLLLIDDLEAVATLGVDALNSLRWLLLRGPARRVWPVVTLQAARYGQVLGWIPMFRTRIFGRIAQAEAVRALGAGAVSGWQGSEAAGQFSLRENGSWLRFWTPLD